MWARGVRNGRDGTFPARAGAGLRLRYACDGAARCALAVAACPTTGARHFAMHVPPEAIGFAAAAAGPAAPRAAAVGVVWDVSGSRAASAEAAPLRRLLAELAASHTEAAAGSGPGPPGARKRP